ncbi:Thiol-disulfide isomerase or thioredoxin [Lachnospiraceae bacterium XBB1006]|nr:Thiol-disulfide isomerase or thioredoxin [Lachnospiraceae bacterium XBB1006]
MLLSSLMNKIKGIGFVALLVCVIFSCACSVKKASEEAGAKNETEQKKENHVEGTAKKFGKLKDFACKTLDKKKFGPKNLAKYDLTIINFWSTWCGPCVEEMPELASFAKALPENVSFVTVCLDGNQVPWEAKKLLKKAGFEGTTVISGNGDFSIVCDRIQFTPTTILVDSEGNLVGDELIGVQENTKETYLAYVNDVLKRMDKEEITLEE